MVSLVRPRATVHPRVCGEHGHITDNLMRSNRFIPACAGNMARTLPHADKITVHPRVCGEHELVYALSQGDVGSSPRVRGTSRQKDSFDGKQRFIPACAGNMARTFPQADKITVHPRVCGEHDNSSHIKQCLDGSSPRVRGTSIRRPPE